MSLYFHLRFHCCEHSMRVECDSGGWFMFGTLGSGGDPITMHPYISHTVHSQCRRYHFHGYINLNNSNGLNIKWWQAIKCGMRSRNFPFTKSVRESGVTQWYIVHLTEDLKPQLKSQNSKPLHTQNASSETNQNSRSINLTAWPHWTDRNSFPVRFCFR